MAIFGREGDNFHVVVDPFNIHVSRRLNFKSDPTAHFKSPLLAFQYVTELVNRGYKFSAYQDFCAAIQIHGDALVGLAGVESRSSGVLVASAPEPPEMVWIRRAAVQWHNPIRWHDVSSPPFPMPERHSSDADVVAPGEQEQ